MRTLLFLLTLLIASPSLALDDWRICLNTHAAGAGKNHVALTDATCYDFAGTTDSKFLSTGHCENIDAIYNADMEGTTHTATVQILSCVAGAGTLANICEPVENKTLTGEASSEVIYGFAAAWVVVDVTANGDSKKGRLLLKCNR